MVGSVMWKVGGRQCEGSGGGDQPAVAGLRSQRQTCGTDGQHAVGWPRQRQSQSWGVGRQARRNGGIMVAEASVGMGRRLWSVNYGSSFRQSETSSLLSLDSTTNAPKTSARVARVANEFGHDNRS